MLEKKFNKTLIIGLGLIGGSFARACHKYGVSDQIYAFDTDKNSLDLALDEKIIDGVSDLENNLQSFDFIVIASPLKTYDKIFKQLGKSASDQAIIIDLGSLKEFATKQIPQNLKANFVPCHPIAGLEKSGFKNSVADLFLDKKFIICKEKSSQDAVEKVAKVINKIGASVEFLEAKQHDKIYSLVSHLPQFLSFLTKEFSPENSTNEFFKTAFRLDNSSPEIWSDIFNLNQKNLEEYYLEFFDNLEKLQKNPELAFNEALSKTQHDENDEIKKFLIDNFASVFFRVLVVVSYLKIKDLKNFKNYSGSGFRDFTSIIEILNYDKNFLRDLIKKNQQNISKLLQSISS